MTVDRSTGRGACDNCLRRTWLLARLAGHIDLHRNRLGPLLALQDEILVTALAGRRIGQIERELDGFDAGAARERAAVAGLAQICRCAAEYPPALAQLQAPPAVLHVAGEPGRLEELCNDAVVAIVGARRPSPYGVDVARSLARGLAAAGLTVISGMAAGIDSAAHRGALDVQGPTVAVLAGSAERAYPADARNLHAQVRGCGAVISELPPGTGVRRWMFPARNRLIAALAALTVVVEARSDSGAMITAAHAGELGRRIGAVPGRATSPLAHGPHRLLRDGALLIEDPQDVLEALFGPDARPVARRTRSALAPGEQALLDALAEGRAASVAVARAGLDPDSGLAALASLELAGRIRREPGGAYSVLP